MNITLNFGTEEAPRHLQLEARTASMNATDDFLVIEQRRTERLTPIIEEQKLLSERMEEKDSTALAQYADSQRRVVNIQFESDVELLQKVVLRKNLTTEDKVIFDQVPQSEFWRNQDLSDIRRFLNYFRGLISTGS
jgi:archaellum biogenesis ATPase FlaH